MALARITQAIRLSRFWAGSAGFSQEEYIFYCLLLRDPFNLQPSL
jgi:hypothetical protein